MSEPSSAAQAAPPPLPQPPASTLSLLRNARYGELEAQLGDVQQDFEAGQRSERELERAFAPFAVPDAALGELLSAWMEAYPQSYPAHVALGQWLLARAWEFRGGMTSDKVSDRGRRGLHYYLERAQGCSSHAATLTHNPLAAQLLHSRVEGTGGNDLTLEDVQAGRFPEWYLHGVEHNPHSYLLRAAMLRSLRTEWGGSDEMMLTFVRGVEAQLSGAQRQRLWAQYHAHLTHYALHFSRDHGAALTHARMAAELHPVGSQILLHALTSNKGVQNGEQERADALEQLLSALERDPEMHLGSNLAVSLAQMDAWKELTLSPRLLAVLTRLMADGDDEAGQALGILALRHKGEGLDPVPALTQLMDAGHSRAASILAAYHAVRPADQEARDQALMRGANLGNADSAAEVYRRWSTFQARFKLQDRDKYRYLLLAADSGDNDARVRLAEGLRRGELELGDDGKLRPYAGPPLQESLDYAKHLLERAAHEDSAAARRALKEARPEHWQEGNRQALAYAKGKRSFNWRSYLWWFVVLGILRVIASFFGHHS